MSDPGFVPARLAIASVWTGGLVGGSIGLLLSCAALVTIVVGNPFLVDRLVLGLALFVLIPLAAGAVLGALVCLVRRVPVEGKRSRKPRPPARRSVAFLAVAGCLTVAATLAAWGLAATAERDVSDRPLKLLLVVIDGADWDVARPLLERGRLPNLGRAIQSGSAGVLTSRHPLFSPIVYTSIASGKVADKHGIRSPQEFTSDAVLVQRIWDILGTALGWKYGVVEWHLTCPPRASPGGFMIPGWLASTDETIPPELWFMRRIRRSGRAGKAPGVVEELKTATAAARHGARLSTLADVAKVAVVGRLGAESDLGMNLRQHKVFVRIVTDVTRLQLRRTGVDMLAIAYTSTDGISHRFWRYYEPSAYPGTDAESVRRYGSAIPDIYAAVDEQLGALTRQLAPDGVLVILSDHGFQAVPQPYPEPRVLRTEVLLRLVGASLDDVTYFEQGGDAFLRPTATDEAENARVRTMLARACSSIVVGDGGPPAFVVQEADRPGTGDDYVFVAITDALKEAALADGRVLASDGAEAPAADLLQVFENSGWHALDGIIVLVGKPFRRGAWIDAASVLDVTPTILAALGLPVASDMDGAVMTAALTDSFLSEHAVTSISSYETETSGPGGERVTQPLPEELRERLRALGYVD